MALGSTQPLTEINTRNLPGGMADNLTDICEPIVWKMWEPRLSQPYGPSRPASGITLSFLPLPIFFMYQLTVIQNPLEAGSH
jgi:hypothetical protein